ncbi:TonB-dependent receptor [Fulvivirga maritima]|uniref:TonB-dependent receptor n=1 Tax=Fulvivirga maritima TaxID=2904247 RepID=UPI001F1FA2D2|nr:TonB-dependent receptor [Fulvivirga maritima]UII25363.1 TonB-dependent receptor [Fulvivirga maritima]
MRLYIFLIIFFCSFSAQAQTTISGKVISYEDSVALPGVSIQNQNTNQWTYTDTNGQFSITLNAKAFELEFHFLGKQEYILRSSDIGNTSQVLIKLKDENLELNEVTVTATPTTSKVGSSIKLDEYAVDQVQSFSVGDILQQLPGQTISAPDFTRSKAITLRSANTTNVNAFGVSFVLDGVALSNDANMQTYDDSNGLLDTDNVNSSIDLRTIPASNIEEVEVITGIPDAKYGNLTSGVVKINRKAGVTPYTLSANLRQGTTSMSLNKGFKINDKGGALSLSFDYLNSNTDPRESLKKFNRINTSAIWSTHNNDNTIRNTLSFTFHNNFDDINYDKDNDDGGQDASSRKDIGFRVSNRLSWKPNTQIIDNISLNAAYSYASQRSYKQQFINNGGKILPTSTETGLAPGEYTPVAYLQKSEVFGKPINISANVSLNKVLKTNNTDHSLSLGTNLSYTDNSGKGKVVSSENALAYIALSSAGDSDGNSTRPLDFDSYVKPRVNYGIYLQDNITHTFANNKELYANIGFRMDMQNGFASFGPRANFGYELTKKWSVRGGIGFASKAPSLSQIYPGDQYFDMLIADFRTNEYSFNLIQTYKQEIGKLNLSPNKSWKYEIGTNYNAKIASLAITAYYNFTYNGIVSDDKYTSVSVPNVDFNFENPNQAPTYQISGYRDILLTYSQAYNGSETKDKGIEFYLNFKKIKAINTSFSLNGSYTHSTTFNSSERFKKSKDPLETEYLYGFNKTQPDIRDQLKLTATITHHISEIGLLISLTAEQFTFSTNYASIIDLYPYAYLNGAGQRIEIAPEERTAEKYSSIVLPESNSTDNRTSIYHNFHLRISKELSNGLSFSFYAYNFLDYQPMVESTISGKMSKNDPISFGAQIKYQF